MPAQCSAATAKPTATRIWAPNLARLLRPRLRRCRTLIQSSTKPMTAAAAVTRITSTPDRVKATWVPAWPMR